MAHPPPKTHRSELTVKQETEHNNKQESKSHWPRVTASNAHLHGHFFVLRVIEVLLHTLVVVLFDLGLQKHTVAYLQTENETERLTERDTQRDRERELHRILRVQSPSSVRRAPATRTGCVLKVTQTQKGLVAGSVTDKQRQQITIKTASRRCSTPQPRMTETSRIDEMHAQLLNKHAHCSNKRETITLKQVQQRLSKQPQWSASNPHSISTQEQRITARTRSKIIKKLPH